MKFVSSAKGVETAAAALQGAADILAEAIAENASLRAYVRDCVLKQGEFVSRVKTKYPEGTTKFEMYRNFQAKTRRIAPHNLLALYRGKQTGFCLLRWTLTRCRCSPF